MVRDERVVVGTFGETQRTEESIIYQEFVPVPVGNYRLSIVVRDQSGSGVGRYEGSFGVPRLELPAIATPIPVYRATPRTDLAAVPDSSPIRAARWTTEPTRCASTSRPMGSRRAASW